jgi:hypothetical protein
VSDDVISVDPAELKRSGVNLDQLATDVARIRDELGYQMASCAHAGGAGDTFAKMWDENVKPGLAAAHDVLTGLANLIETRAGVVVGSGDVYHEGSATASDIAGGHGRKGG